MNKIGMVTLVGAGPGDEELITLKGANRLKVCEVVVYDRLVSYNLLDMVPQTCEKIYVGKEVGGNSLSQEEINEVIIKKAQEGKRVVRLKGGDPFVFGRGGEEALALQREGIPYEVIPGITSAIATATYAGIPVTHRGVSQSFHVITGHTKDTESCLTDNYETLAKLDGTLIFLMGMGNLPEIINKLTTYGKDSNTPVAIVSNGTTMKQKTVKGTLKNILDKASKANITAPAVIIIGEVANLNVNPSFYGKLSGKRIGITGTRNIANKLALKLKDLGAHVWDLSFLTVKEIEDKTEIEKAVLSLKAYTWVVFTSTNGVELFFKYLKENQVDYRRLSHLSFAVVGSGTKEALIGQGFIPDYMPNTYTTEDLALGLVPILSKNDKVLIPRAIHGSLELTKIFKAHQIPFTDLKIYSVEVNEEKYEKLMQDIMGLDYITFASPSGVDAFFKNQDKEMYDKIKNTTLVCIGEVTAKTLAHYGITNYIKAEEYTVDGIVNAILKDLAKN